MRQLAYEAADCGLLSPDLAAGINRVKGVKQLGVRLGNWLTAEQGQALWQAPDRQLVKGKRDRAILAPYWRSPGREPQRLTDLIVAATRSFCVYTLLDSRYRRVVRFLRRQRLWQLSAVAGFRPRP